MKQNYNPKKLSKKQRHMKKWIPDGIYCEGMGIGKHKTPCPFWHSLNCQHKKSECEFKHNCDDDCDKCTEEISYCSFLNYKEYGQYPLGDTCKVCGIRDNHS